MHQANHGLGLGLGLGGDDDFNSFFAKLGDETFWGLGVGDHCFDGVEGAEV